jgi:hypothetical protein
VLAGDERSLAIQPAPRMVQRGEGRGLGRPDLVVHGVEHGEGFAEQASYHSLITLLIWSAVCCIKG